MLVITNSLLLLKLTSVWKSVDMLLHTPKIDSQTYLLVIPLNWKQYAKFNIFVMDWMVNINKADCNGFLPHNIVCITLAAAKSHLRFQWLGKGSKKHFRFKGKGHMLPMGPIFFKKVCNFRGKIGQIIGMHSPLRFSAHWLDPPLAILNIPPLNCWLVTIAFENLNYHIWVNNIG